jgi:IclR family transcriptional regulator, acetate operon repressor
VSISRAIAVAEYLADHGPTSLRGLARALGLPVGSAHRLVAALADEAVVERTPDDEWELSYRLLNIAGRQLGRLGLPAVARPALERLATETGRTAFLAVRSGNQVVYLDKVQTDAQVQLYVELGARRPLHSTALGKAMLAFQPDEQRERFLATAELSALTPQTITDPDTLRHQLEGVRRLGYAVDREEAVLGVHCLAVPLRDHAGRTVGALSVAGPDARIGAAAAEFLAPVLAAGDDASRRLGAS